ncbi:MAG: hypothetical protein K2P14_08215 [Anaeroplasmataceae bacterium]|nr:hypothetical protein [Anaeroplasmataceae bacterium]
MKCLRIFYYFLERYAKLFMCMKNLNTDVVFFSNVTEISNSNQSIFNIEGGNKEIPIVSSTRSVENKDILTITSLKFLLSINALESISDHPHGSNEDAETTIHFDKEYEFNIRMADPNSGTFVDLYSESFIPKDTSISLCRKIFSKKMLFKFNNIKVTQPRNSKGEKKDLCILKILARLRGEDKWNVQSVHPVRLVSP